MVLIIAYTYEHGHMPKKMYTHMLTSTVLLSKVSPKFIFALNLGMCPYLEIGSCRYYLLGLEKVVLD